MEPALEIVIGKLIETAYAEVSKLRETAAAGASISVSSSRTALLQHQEELHRWTSAVTAGAFPHTRRLGDVIIDLDLHVTPRRKQLESSSAELKVSDLAFSAGNITLLGDPGAGKTTSIKQLIRVLLARRSREGLPLLIRLRELHQKESLLDRLRSILGIGITSIPPSEGMSSEEAEIERRRALLTVISRFLNCFGTVVFLDGLDELHPNKRDEVLRVFRQLALGASRSRFIMTCRSGDFHYSIDNCNVVELRPLTEQQIQRFVTLWLHRDEDISTFLAALSNSPYNDAAVRPLTLAHLCTLFTKYRRVPEKPRSIYRLVVNLLLEEWDADRSVERVTNFDHFDTESKREFLAHLAYTLTRVTRSASFTHQEIANAYSMICERYNLSPRDVRAVVREIEAHSGLLVQSKYETYEFAHKSLQEYLTADFITKLPNVPTTRDLVRTMPHEFAVAVALSADASGYFNALVFGPLDTLAQDTELIRAFLHRMLLEKPDFHPGPSLGIAVLYLTSRLLIGRSTKTWAVYDEIESVLSLLYVDLRIQKSLSYMPHLYELVVQEDSRLVYRWKKPSVEWPREIEVRTRASAIRRVLLEKHEPEVLSSTNAEKTP